MGYGAMFYFFLPVIEFEEVFQFTALFQNDASNLPVVFDKDQLLTTHIVQRMTRLCFCRGKTFHPGTEKYYHSDLHVYP